MGSALALELSVNHSIRPFCLLLPLVVAACGSEGGNDDCLPGAAIDCTCDNGRPGLGTCGEEGCHCAPAYALVAEPTSVDFGEVRRDAFQDMDLVLRNGAPHAVRFRWVAFLGEDAASFSIPDPLPSELSAGSSLHLLLRLKPVAPGMPVARLRIEPDEQDVAPVEIGVTGRVPGPVLACAPPELVFGDAYVGGRTSGTVACWNGGLAGEYDEARLTFDRFTLSGEGFAGGWASPADGLAVGESTTIDLIFEPMAPGEHRGTLTIGSPEGVREIPLFGLASAPPACQIAASIARIGVVPAGAATMLELVVRNLRSDAPCILHDVTLCEGTDPAYSLPEGSYDRVVISGGDTARFPVRFAPEVDFCPDPREVGCIEFQLEPSDDGHRSIPLPCWTSGDSAIIAPKELDFGDLPICSTGLREFQVINTTGIPLVYRAVGFDEGTSGNFSLRSEPLPGTRLQQGLSLTFSVAYLPWEGGFDMGTVWVEFDELAAPLVAHLMGHAIEAPPWRDSFVQGARPKVDLLFVVDNGTTMGPESAHLVAQYGRLAERLFADGLDFHVAVTTTGLVAGDSGCPGGASGGEDGRLFPVDGARPRILDRTTPDLRATLESNLAVGTCHAEPPQLLEAALRALTPPLSTSADDPRHDDPLDGNLGFLRDDAVLWVVAVSDRPDASPGDLSAYFTAFQMLKGGFRQSHMFDFHAITGDLPTGCTATDGRSADAGDRLIAMAGLGGGEHLSICADSWPATFGQWFDAGPRICFALTSVPSDRDGDGTISDGDLRVYVDGAELPAVTNGVRAWSYNWNSVCFAPGHVPEAGASIEVEYSLTCPLP